MQIMIRPIITFIISGVTVLFWANFSSVHAQIALYDGNPIEIRFTDVGASQLTQSRRNISLNEIGTIISPDLGEVDFEWIPFNIEHSDAANSFIRDERQFVSIGRLYTNIERQLFTVSFRNLSEYDFGGMMVAFDFVAHAVEIPANKTIRLMFRVNDGEWQYAENGLLNTNRLRADDREFSSVSVQLNLNQIFLRSGDQIHFMWIHEEDDYDNLPLFLQRIEVFPDISRRTKLNRGSLIITEIMPVSNVDGTDFEYLELYNPTNEEVQLKGIEIKTSAGSHIIQQDVIVPSYGVIVLSNLDISGINGIQHSYYYSGSIIPQSGGRIEIIQQNEAISIATYEPAESGIALQLNEMINAYDGYTSLTNLAPADESFFPEPYGSPGSVSKTFPIYRRTLQQQGWYLLSPPGKLNARLSRHPSIQYFSLNGEPVSPDLIEPYTPFFVYKNNRDPVIIYAESVQRITTSESYLREYQFSDGLRLISAAHPTDTNFESVLRRNGVIIPPLVKQWDERAQAFRLAYPDQARLLNWTPFILPSQFRTYAAAGSAGRRGVTEMPRNITFSLFEGDGSNRMVIDRAVLGFLPPSVNGEQIRYDLPKIIPAYRTPSNTLAGSAFLYLSSPESREPNNSFIHLPYEINSEYTVGLGYQLTPEQTSGQAILEWRIPPDIPDDWIIELKDHQTGLSVNMRDENRYRFRYSVVQNQLEADDRYAAISTATVTERNRFSIELKPFEEIKEIVEELRPGSIELRQNYPNPFNPSTNVTFYLPEERTVRVAIYNIVGQQVAILIDDNLQAGEHSVTWDATNNPSGIYIVQLETGNRILTRKITLIK